MNIDVVSGDILDLKADVLICSANPFLTLSGGVGGALLLRYGPHMQHWLQQYLADRGVRRVEPGTVVRAPACGTPYRAVLHAVAVDGAYQSSSAMVTQVLETALREADAKAASTVAVPALATGYGRLSIADFAAGLAEVGGLELSRVAHLLVCLRHDHDAAEVRHVLQGDTRQ